MDVDVCFGELMLFKTEICISDPVWNRRRHVDVIQERKTIVRRPSTELGQPPTLCVGPSLFLSMFNDISFDGKGRRRMCGKFQSRLHTCKEVWYWTVVISWSKFRKEVVFYGRGIVHKEFGTTLRTRCCWNLPKAHVQVSVPKLHFQRSTQKQRTRKTVDSRRPNDG